jgi:hypothetical protein
LDLLDLKNIIFQILMPKEKKKESNKKKVSFDLTPTIYMEENEELSKMLQEARKSDYFQRQLDKLRMHNMLTPILSPEHRDKIMLRNNLF